MPKHKKKRPEKHKERGQEQEQKSTATKANISQISVSLQKPTSTNTGSPVPQQESASTEATTEAEQGPVLVYLLDADGCAFVEDNFQLIKHIIDAQHRTHASKIIISIASYRQTIGDELVNDECYHTGCFVTKSELIANELRRQLSSTNPNCKVEHDHMLIGDLVNTSFTDPSCYDFVKAHNENTQSIREEIQKDASSANFCNPFNFLRYSHGSLKTYVAYWKLQEAAIRNRGRRIEGYFIDNEIRYLGDVARNLSGSTPSWSLSKNVSLTTVLYDTAALKRPKIEEKETIQGTEETPELGYKDKLRNVFSPQIQESCQDRLYTSDGLIAHCEEEKRFKASPREAAKCRLKGGIIATAYDSSLNPELLDQHCDATKKLLKQLKKAKISEKLLNKIQKEIQTPSSRLTPEQLNNVNQFLHSRFGIGPNALVYNKSILDRPQKESTTCDASTEATRGSAQSATLQTPAPLPPSASPTAYPTPAELVVKARTKMNAYAISPSEEIARLAAANPWLISHR